MSSPHRVAPPEQSRVFLPMPPVMCCDAFTRVVESDQRLYPFIEFARSQQTSCSQSKWTTRLRIELHIGELLDKTRYLTWQRCDNCHDCNSILAFVRCRLISLHWWCLTPTNPRRAHAMKQVTCTGQSQRVVKLVVSAIWAHFHFAQPAQNT